MSISASYPTLRPTLLLDFANSGRLDPRVTFSRASTATYFDETGVLRTAANDTPRFDYDPATLAARGFLIEEARTNSIRNNTMQGAVAGTPGTLPTNWVTVGAGLGTLTREIVGVGVVNGISYIDFRLSGTTSTVSYGYQAEQYTAIPAVSGQTWTGSMYVALVGGSITNINSVQLNIVERDSGAVNIGTTAQPLSLTSTLSRYSVSRTLDQGASTAYVSNTIVLGFASGVAIDITIRIGLPQLELGAFATSVIPTTTTALTRSADVASVNTLSPWFNATEGTLYVEASPQASNSNSYVIAGINDATASNRITLSKLVTTGNASLAVLVSGVTQASTNSGAWTATGKLAGAYKLDDFASSLNGSVPATDTSGTIPTVTQLTLGRRGDGGNQLNGYIRRITYYPRRLSNAELQAITA